MGQVFGDLWNWNFSVTDCWTVTAERGFLMTPDPVEDPRPFVANPTASTLTEVLAAARGLSSLMEQGHYRPLAEALPVPEFSEAAGSTDLRALERLHQIYAFLANAYLWVPGEAPTRILPEAIAVPFVRLSERVGRPPVLSYANTQLCNWRRIDRGRPVVVENIAPIQVFQALPDEAWFWIVHIAIEAAGAPAVMAARKAVCAAGDRDEDGLEVAMTVVCEGLDAILALARRIPEGCDPDVYFRTLRPFLFSHPEGIVFEGVERFAGKPQVFLGQTGAQSSLMPAICGALGLRHGRSDLTEYLEAVRAYMPKAHRDFLAGLNGGVVRDFVAAGGGGAQLRALYNDCVSRVVDFRRTHLGLAARFIANKVDSPIGTGGTEFMTWLKQMTAETQAQML